MPEKKEMHILLRMLLGFLSFLLSLCLCATVLVTALVVDLRVLTSKDTLSTVIEQLMVAPAPAADRLSAAPPSEMSSSQLTDLIFDLLEENYEGEIPVTKEEVNNFLEQSTLPEFVADKGAGFVEDFINGTTNTTITKDEISQLLEENKTLIEETFDMELDDQTCNEIIDQVDQLEIDKVFREEIVGEVDNTEIMDGMTVRDALDLLNQIASVTTILILAGIDLFIVVLLFFTNRMRFPGTMVSVGIPMLLIGSLLSSPIIGLQVAPQVLSGLEPMIVSTVHTLVGAIAPVHYTVLGLGIALIIGAIVVSCLTKKKPQADTE